MTRPETDPFIAAQLARLTSHADWVRTLEISRRFPRYSFSNRLLIALQRETATYVAGFGTWRRLGRWVKKGEKGLRIMAPLVRRAPDDIHSIDEPKTEVYGYRTVAVFDLEQTEGAPFEPPKPQLLSGRSKTAMLRHLLQTSPVPVSLVDPDVLGGANGDYHTHLGRIRIRSDVSPNQQLKTLLHELAHHYGNTPQSSRLPRDWEEVAAESAAFVVAGYLGMDTVSYSAAYVAGWSDANPEILRVMTDSVSVRIAALVTLLPPDGFETDGLDGC